MRQTMNYLIEIEKHSLIFQQCLNFIFGIEILHTLKLQAILPFFTICNVDFDPSQL